MSRIQAAIIIPHFNDNQRLERCLAALIPQLTSGTEVIVVDNGSTVEPMYLCDRFPEVRFIVEARSGAAHARNRGVAETTAKYLFFLDSDVLPAANWLKNALGLVSRGDLVGGHIAVFDETPPPRTGAQAFEAVFAFNNRHYVETKGFSVTANLLTHRSVFESIGGFAPSVSEDLEWCHRATRAGFSLVFAADLCVSHPSRADMPALLRKWQRLTREAFGVNGNTPRAQLRWAVKAFGMPVSVLVHTPRVLLHPALRDWGERWRAWTTLLLLRNLRMIWMLRQVFGRDLS